MGIQEAPSRIPLFPRHSSWEYRRRESSDLDERFPKHGLAVHFLWSHVRRSSSSREREDLHTVGFSRLEILRCEEYLGAKDSGPLYMSYRQSNV